ncbi:hypothetical protein T439DRAFT_15037 [Meredithblackwellia eburnea MCA 4105]
MAAPSPSGSSMGPFIPDDDDDDDIDLCFSSTESQSSSSGGGNHSGSSSATTNTKAQSRKKLAKAQPSSISGAAAAAAASGSKVRPCGPCRMRRVKCDRTPGTDETVDCVKCSLKGIVCTPMPPRAKRKQVNRSGPLISAAKAVYGEAGAPKDSSSSSETSPTHVPPQPASAVAVRLNTSELRGSLIASLLDFYLEFLKENVGFFMELNIQAKFEAAGRQLCHLDDQSQVLMAAMAATAARTSDHPLIVGVCPIRVPDIPKTSFIGTDLSEYGRRRVAACSSLTEYAISLADEKKTLRVASLESISALMLLEGLVDSWDNDDVGTGTGTGLAKKSRSPWTTSYLGHARRFVETIQPVSSPEWDNGPVSRSIIVWTAFLREAVVSGKVGRASMFTEDDLELMWGSYRPCSVQQMINSVPAGYDAERAFGELFDSWMASLIKVALNITPRLTGLKARRQTEADLQFLCETMETLDLAQRATPVLAERGLAREQARERGECQWKEPFGCPNGNFFFGKNFRSLQLVRCTQCFLIHDIVTQRVAELKALLESKPQSVNPDYAPRLLAVREQTHFRAVAAAREVSSILRVKPLVQRNGGGWRMDRPEKSRTAVWWHEGMGPLAHQSPDNRGRRDGHFFLVRCQIERAGVDP